MSRSRIVVTGGLGFIGSHIVSRLIKRHSVVISDYYKDLIPKYEETRPEILADLYKNASACADLVEPQELLRTDFNDVRAIVHAGAVVDTTDLGSDRLWFDNVEYMRHLVNASPGVPVIFLSSASVYGTDGYPNNPYGMTKSIGEKILESDVRYSTCLRLFNVFGPNEGHKGKMASIAWKLARAYKNGDRFDLHSPDAERDLVPVDAVVDAVQHELDMINNSWRQMIYDVGTGTATSFRELDNYIMQATGNTTSCIRIVPMPAEYAGRYQGYTRAGMHGIDRRSGMTTREGVEKYYGK